MKILAKAGAKGEPIATPWIWQENIKSNLIKNTHPPFLINEVIKKYIDHKLSGNQNRLKNVYYLKLPYINNIFTILKINF